MAAPLAKPAGKPSDGTLAHVETAVGTTHDAATGIDGEVGTFSAKVGAQNELQISAGRLAHRGADNAQTLEGPSARVAAGIHNADASTGWNFAATAALATVEASSELGKEEGPITRVTTGYGLGAVGVELSLGVRENKETKKPELCARVGLEVLIGFTVGGCAPL